MRSVAFALAAALAAALAGCSSDPVTGPPPLSVPTTSAVAPTTGAVIATLATLPPAPPVETWVTKGSDFQRTLDLNMMTALINMGLPTGEADEAAARNLAYFLCSELRAGTSESEVRNLVSEVYPSADMIDAMGIVLASQHYCLDTYTPG